MFSGEELMGFLEMASYCALNDYEAQMMCERTGQRIEQLATRVEALVVTRGAEGSQIHVGGQRIDIPCVKADEVVDPTGCGDAFRGGLLYGIDNGFDWEKTGRLASVMGSIKIAHRGGQNHAPDRDAIAARYAAAFGEQPW
jgi:adenosine kinase